MLETEETFAEYIIQQVKKEKREQNLKIDYVHPTNEISEGYIIVNYRKRNLERMELLDGRLSMLLPDDWKLQKEEAHILYTYGSTVEREIMVLFLQNVEGVKGLEESLLEVNRHSEEKFSILERGCIKNRQGIEIEYRMVSDEKEVFFILFECIVGNQMIQGNFVVHYYRQKVWKKVIPQILEQLEIDMDGGRI